jgi:hypothetical protein
LSFPANPAANCWRFIQVGGSLQGIYVRDRFRSLDWQDCARHHACVQAPATKRLGDILYADKSKIRVSAPLDAAFSVPVRIIARQSITVDDCQITSPWDGSIRILDLPKPKQDACYRLGTLSCRAEDFLNDKIGNQFTLRRGSIMEGVVLASGFPIPREMKGGVVNLRITLTDCFHRETWADINAVVRRNSERMVYGSEDLPRLPGKGDRARNGSGLYDSDPEGIQERRGSIERSEEGEQRPRNPKVGKPQ